MASLWRTTWALLLLWLCSADAAWTANNTGHECALRPGTRVRVDIASYGQSPHLERILQALSELDPAWNFSVHVMLHVTIPYTRPAPHLRLSQTLYNASIGVHLVSQLWVHWNRALDANAYDIYMYLDDDVHVMWRHIFHLCNATRLLAHTRYRPGLLRVETPDGSLLRRANSGHAFLTDIGWVKGHEPTLRVRSVQRRQFLLPTHPYAATLLLTATDLQALRQSPQWSAEVWRNHSGEREYAAGYWLHSPTNDGLVQKVVPLDGHEEFLVQHLGSKYVKKSLQFLHSLGYYTPKQVEGALRSLPWLLRYAHPQVSHIIAVARNSKGRPRVLAMPPKLPQYAADLCQWPPGSKPKKKDNAKKRRK